MCPRTHLFKEKCPPSGETRLMSNNERWTAADIVRMCMCIKCPHNYFGLTLAIVRTYFRCGDLGRMTWFTSHQCLRHQWPMIRCDCDEVICAGCGEPGRECNWINMLPFAFRSVSRSDCRTLLRVTRSLTVIQFKNKTDATEVACQHPTWPSG